MTQQPPFKIVIDNREKIPYDFASVPARRVGEPVIRDVPTVRKYLPSGDYSIEGYEDKVAIERKTLEDLYGTLGRGHARFKKEMERLEAYQFAAIVIEADLSEICRPHKARYDWRSKANPRAIYGTIISWLPQFQTQWLIVGTRNRGQMMTFHLLEKFWELQHGQ